MESKQKTILELLLPCLLCAAVGSGLTFAGLAFSDRAAYQPGDWVESKITRKCGIVHRAENRMNPNYYEVRFPDGDYRQGYWIGYFFEGELNWCSSPISGTSRITVSLLESAATSSALRAVK